MERSDERLSTRDIASPGGASPGGADAETAAEPERERFVRDDEDGGAVAADRVDPVGDGDVVTDEPVEGRGPSRESIADDRAAVDDRGDAAADDRASAAAAVPAAAAAAEGDRDIDRDTDTHADTRDTTAASTDTATTGRSADDAAPLLADSEGFQSRWEEIQVRFVDEPRGAVEDADALVATVMQRLAEGFAQERERLESQWGRGEDISTEDLRVALQRYRSFFQRLLST
jgi:hypothetical protein